MHLATYFALQCTNYYFLPLHTDPLQPAVCSKPHFTRTFCIWPCTSLHSSSQLSWLQQSLPYNPWAYYTLQHLCVLASATQSGVNWNLHFNQRPRWLMCTQQNLRSTGRLHDAPIAQDWTVQEPKSTQSPAIHCIAPSDPSPRTLYQWIPHNPWYHNSLQFGS